MGLDICHVKPSKMTNETLEYFTLDEFNHFPQFLVTHEHLITTINNVDGSQTDILYYIEMGYQRKQVTDNFIDIFENDKLYFDIDSVKKAKQFLKANTNEEQKNLESAFQSYFIDNFVEGESVFFISW